MTLITMDRRALAAALKDGDAIVEKSQIEVYSNVRLAVAKGIASLTFTDGTMWLGTQVTADADSITATTIPSGLLSSAAGSMEGEMLTIETTEGRATIKSGRSRLSMATLPADIYPIPDWPDAVVYGASVEAKDLARALTAASYAAPDMDFGKYIPAVRVTSERDAGGGIIDFCTADGTRLAAVSVNNKGDEIPAFNLPLKAARTVARLAGDVGGHIRFSATQNVAAFDIGNWRVLSKLVDAPFVPFAALLDERADKPIIFDSRELFRALGRLSLISDRYSIGVKLEVTNDEMTISLTNAKIGDAREVVTVGYEGDPLTLGYSLRFLRDALRTLAEGDAEMHVIEPVRRALIVGRDEPDSIHIIGPFKI